MTETTFDCLIDDRVRGRLYNGRVTLRRGPAAPGAEPRQGLRATLRRERASLCDVDVAGPSGVRERFVLEDVTGHGVRILRDARGGLDERVTCTLWHLGAPLALRVLEELRADARGRPTLGDAPKYSTNSRGPGWTGTSASFARVS